MQILLKPKIPAGGSGRLYYVVMAFLFIDVLNILTFAGMAISGIALGVSSPFPTWFRNGTDICFYVGLFLTLTSLPFLAFAQHRIRAGISAALAFGTVIIIAFLTSQG
jgi:hypothetical protein